MSKSKKQHGRSRADRRPIWRRRGALVHALRQPARARPANGARPGSRAPGASSSGCGGWSASDERGEGEDKALDRKLHQTIAAVGAEYRGARLQQGGREHLRARQRDREGAALGRRAARRSRRCCGSSRRWCRISPRRPGRRRAREGLIADAAWPEADPALLVEDEVTIAIQVNGKLRDTLTAPKGAPKEELEALALASEKVQRILDGAAAAQGDRRARPAGEHRRMRRALAPRLARCWRWRAAACGRSTPAAARGRWRRRCAASQVAPIAGRAGWLVRTALRGPARQRATATRRATGSRSSSTTTSPASASARDDAVTRERRTLRARYRLVDARARHGAARRHRRLGRRHRRGLAPNMRPSPPSRPRSSGSSVEVADQIVTRVALYARGRRGAPAQ